MKTPGKIGLCVVGLCLAVFLLRVTAPAELHCSLLPELADRKLAPAKIKALAWPSDSLDWRDEPGPWLAKRREELYPELLAALDAKPVAVAESVLRILEEGPLKPELADALVRIAADRDHRLRAKATFVLCRFPDHPRARSILAAALADAARFPDPLERARFAEALHDGEKTVELLQPALRSGSEFNVASVIARLGASGHPAAIAPLEEQTRRSEWRIVAQSYLALNAVDPRGHGLGEGPKDLLMRTGHIYKGGGRLSSAWLNELAAWPQVELRPFVMQMLGTDAASEAARLLGIWKVRDALPELERLLWTQRNWQVGDVVEACLGIEAGELVADEIVKRAMRCHDEFDCERVVSAVASANVPLERRLALLRRIRTQQGTTWPEVIPHSLRAEQPNRVALVEPLFETEDDVRGLGAFAQLVAEDPRSEYRRGLRRALGIVSDQNSSELRGPLATAATAIVKASSNLDLPELPVHAQDHKQQRHQNGGSDMKPAEPGQNQNRAKKRRRAG